MAFCLVRPHGYPKARTKGVEVHGHDAYKDPRSTTQDKTFPKNLWIAAEFSLPKPVIHYEHGWRTGAAIFLQDRATQQRRHAQIVKSVRRYVRTTRQNTGGFAVVIEEASRDPVSDQDRKSTRLNSSHGYISYAVFCLKRKTSLLIGQ